MENWSWVMDLIMKVNFKMEKLKDVVIGHGRTMAIVTQEILSSKHL